MANIGYMQDQFESQKNVKAGTYTLLICGALLCVLLFIRWSLPALPPPPVDEGIEVNLGNSDMGLGDDQHFFQDSLPQMISKLMFHQRQQ